MAHQKAVGTPVAGSVSGMLYECVAAQLSIRSQSSQINKNWAARRGARGHPPWGPGPPAVGPGANRRGARGHPPGGPGPPRTGMGVTPDWYGGHPGLVWGSPPQNVENRRKSKILNALGMPSPVRIQPNIPNPPEMGKKHIKNIPIYIGYIELGPPISLGGVAYFP